MIRKMTHINSTREPYSSHERYSPGIDEGCWKQAFHGATEELSLNCIVTETFSAVGWLSRLSRVPTAAVGETRKSVRWIKRTSLCTPINVAARTYVQCSLSFQRRACLFEQEETGHDTSTRIT